MTDFQEKAYWHDHCCFRQRRAISRFIGEHKLYGVLYQSENLKNGNKNARRRLFRQDSRSLRQLIGRIIVHNSALAYEKNLQKFQSWRGKLPPLKKAKLRPANTVLSESDVDSEGEDISDDDDDDDDGVDDDDDDDDDDFQPEADPVEDLEAGGEPESEDWSPHNADSEDADKMEPDESSQNSQEQTRPKFAMKMPASAAVHTSSLAEAIEDVRRDVKSTKSASPSASPTKRKAEDDGNEAKMPAKRRMKISAEEADGVPWVSNAPATKPQEKPAMDAALSQAYEAQEAEKAKQVAQREKNLEQARNEMHESAKKMREVEASFSPPTPPAPRPPPPPTGLDQSGPPNAVKKAPEKHEKQAATEQATQHVQQQAVVTEHRAQAKPGQPPRGPPYDVSLVEGFVEMRRNLAVGTAPSEMRVTFQFDTVHGPVKLYMNLGMARKISIRMRVYDQDHEVKYNPRIFYPLDGAGLAQNLLEQVCENLKK